MQYTQDYDEVMLRQNQGPSVTYTRIDGVAYTGYMLWPTTIYPYIKNLQMYACPSNSFVWNGTYTGSSCYGYLSICSGAALSTFTKPAETIALYDVRSACGFTNQYAPGVGTAAPASGSPPDPGYCDSGFGNLHNEGANTLFVDGHVKWFSLVSGLGDRNMWSK